MAARGRVQTHATPAIGSAMAELVSSLQEVLPDADIRKEDIIHPTPSRMQTIYFKMLLEFGFSETTMGQVNFNLLSGGEGCLDLLQDTAHIDALQTACRYFFRCIGHQEKIPFGLLDLIEPDPQRVKRFLSAMTNFWQFCNNHYESANMTKDKVLHLKQDIKTLKNDLQCYNRQGEEIRRRNAEAVVVEKNLAAQEQSLTAELESMGKANETCQDVRKDMKAKMEEAAKEERSIAKDVEQLENEEKNLERLFRNSDIKEELKNDHAQIKDVLYSKDEEETDRKKKIAQAEARVRYIDSALKTLQAVVAKNEKIQSVSSDVGALQRQFEMRKATSGTLDSQLQLLRQKLHEVRARDSALVAKWRNRKDAKMVETTNLRQELDTVKHGLSEEEIISSNFTSRTERAEKDIALADDLLANDFDSVKNEYYKIKEVLDSVLRDIDTDIDDVAEAFSEL